jgi:hypothetical protein
MRGAGIADELLTASIQYIINVAMTLPAILYLDRIGRRPALLVGSFMMAVWLFTVGALQASYGNPNPDSTDKDISWVVPKEHSAVSKGIVACSYLFVATFATTWGPTSWTYPSEIFPAKVRAKAVSLATASNWVSILNIRPSRFRRLIITTDLELHSRFCSATSTVEHQLEDVYDLRNFQCSSFHPHVPHCTRDQGQDARGGKSLSHILLYIHG